MSLPAMVDEGDIDQKTVERLYGFVRLVPDFPKTGVTFTDFFPLVSDQEGLALLINTMADICGRWKPQAIAAMESRGFIVGVPLAIKLGVGFVPIRKRNKLPPPVHGVDFDMEYGRERLEISTDAFKEGQRVVIVDDVLATGMTARSATELVRKCGADVRGFLVVIELLKLGGRAALHTDLETRSLLKF